MPVNRKFLSCEEFGTCSRLLNALLRGNTELLYCAVHLHEGFTGKTQPPSAGQEWAKSCLQTAENKNVFANNPCLFTKTCQNRYVVCQSPVVKQTLFGSSIVVIVKGRPFAVEQSVFFVCPVVFGGFVLDGFL